VLDAFKAADQVLLSGVQGITDLITTPGLINLDFADVKSVMSGAGSALMGIGTARGDDRAVAAAEMAISSPLLEASIDGAHGVLLSIQGGSDLGLFEINEAAQLVANSAAPDANIIFGAVIDDALGDEVRVTVIAAGFDEPQSGRTRPRTTAYSAALPSAELAASAAAANASGASSDWRRFQLSDSKPAAIPATSAADLSSAAGSAEHAADNSASDVAGFGGTGASSTASSTGADNEAAGPGGPGADGVKIDGIPSPRPGNPESAQAAKDGGQNGARPAAAGRPAESAGTRRKSVVFEEDDELDVPDFLK
jgi:cell division protein FtsZ